MMLITFIPDLKCEHNTKLLQYIHSLVKKFGIVDIKLTSATVITNGYLSRNSLFATIKYTTDSVSVFNPKYSS